MYIFAPICVFPQARFCSSLLFCFRELNRFLEISVRDPRKILRVSRNSKLDPQNLVLEPRKSKLETRNSSLETRFSKTSRIANRDCQLTFERYCTCKLHFCVHMKRFHGCQRSGNGLGKNHQGHK